MAKDYDRLQCIPIFKERMVFKYSFVFLSGWSDQLSVFSILVGLGDISSRYDRFSQRAKEEAEEKREIAMQAQFMTGIQLVCTSVQAGYAVENAFREALQELGKMYGEEDFVIREFQFIVSQVGVNRTIESLLLDLGQRSQVEDIRNFAEVFYTAKRTGGDLLAIIRNTVSCIQQRQETRMEIETSLSGKVMEQNLMSVIPMFILMYVNLTSPELMQVMYHNGLGIMVMSFCLMLYLGAYFWGRKIMDIEV